VQIFKADGIAVHGIGNRSGRRKAAAMAAISGTGWGGARVKGPDWVMPHIHPDALPFIAWQADKAVAQCRGMLVPAPPGCPQSVFDATPEYAEEEEDPDADSEMA